MKAKRKGKVYKITSPTGRIYIGSTYQTLYQRWYSYKTLQCKSQSKLYRSLKKYGPENHVFECIWRGLIEDMFKMERTFGDLYEVLDKHKGLNLSLPGYDDVPVLYSEERLQIARNCWTDERRKSMSIKFSGKNNPSFGKPLSEKTKQLLSEALTGRKSSDETKEKVRVTSTGRIMPPRTVEYSEKVSKIHSGKKYPTSVANIKKASNKQKTPIDMFDINWNYIKTFDSMREAADFLNDSPANICVSCKSGTKVVKNHRFKYAPKPDKRESLMQINHKTDEVIKIWDTISKAVETLGISRQNITGVCNGRGITAGGFKWKYVNE